MKYLIIFFLSILLINCTGFSSTEDINKSEIIEMLDDIRIAFNMADPDQIISHYHSDFFHNGDLYEDELIKWESRLINYAEMDMLDIEIDINGEFAIAYLTLSFTEQSDTDSWEEPSEENGDLSYLIFDGNEWQIYGNQLNGDQSP